MAPTRRALLRRASAAGVLGLLAGCTDGGLGGGTGPGGGTDTPTATETTTPAPTSTVPAETTADETQDSMEDGTTTETEPPSTQTEPEPTTEERTTTTETTTETTETTTTETMTAEPAESKTVALEGFAFNPVRAFVDPGTTVRWVNEDNAAHDVTSTQFHDAAETWDFSQGISGGESVSYTFESAGVYEYYCTIHGRSSMCGAIVVGDASLSADLPCESGGYGGGGGGYGGGDDGDDDDDGGYAIDGLGS
ncbi:MAG: plastocyanin [Natronomonas sp.]|jgi:plastocyanin